MNQPAPQPNPQPDTERFEVKTHRVTCDGGRPPLGHPLVYLEMGGEREVTCPYCSRVYALRAGVKVSKGH